MLSHAPGTRQRSSAEPRAAAVSLKRAKRPSRRRGCAWLAPSARPDSCVHGDCGFALRQLRLEPMHGATNKVIRALGDDGSLSAEHDPRITWEDLRFVY